MTQSSFTEPTYSQADLYVASLVASLKSGTQWFYWIAALSLVNSLIVTFGGSVSFIVGLGITQLIDGLAREGIANGTAIAIAANVLISAGFAAVAYFGGKNIVWVTILGLVLYVLDAGIFLLVQDWWSIGFHAYATYAIWRGLSAGLELKKLQAQAAAQPQTAL